MVIRTCRGIVDVTVFGRSYDLHCNGVLLWTGWQDDVAITEGVAMAHAAMLVQRKGEA